MDHYFLDAFFLCNFQEICTIGKIQSDLVQLGQRIPSQNGEEKSKEKNSHLKEL